MSKFPSVRLGDVADVNWGDTSVTKASYVNDGFPAYSATGCDGFLPYADFDHPAIVLSAIGARCGKTWFASGKWSCIKNTIRYWSISEQLDNRYLFWATADEDFWPKRGAAQPFITIGDARELRIPLPSLLEQRRIAAILDKADALCAKRREALAQLDRLAQSIFVEMFGDPESNERPFPVAELQDLCSRVTDGTHQSPKWEQSGIPFLFISNIVDGGVTFETDKYISRETYDQLTRRCKIEAGDVLYTTVGSYGNTAIVDGKRDFCFQRHIAHIKPNPTLLDSVFCAVMLESTGIRRQVDQSARGVAQKTVNLSDLKTLKVFAPPMKVQREFRMKVEVVRHVKELYSQATKNGDALFLSLQERAFRGDL